MPKELFSLISSSYSAERAFEYCSSMLFSKQKTVLRTNTNKIPRETLIYLLQKHYGIISKKTEYSPLGIQILEKDSMNLYKTKEFAKGYFEPQNEAVQMSLLKIKPRNSDKILDFRCGLGEKSLAVASVNKGLEVYLHSKIESALDSCRTTFERHGIPFKILREGDGLRSFDWVLIEIASTETGLLREKPELKIKFSFPALEQILDRQKKILEECVQYVKPKTGKLVVLSMSLLREENIEQIKRICMKKGLEVLDGKVMQSFPNEEGMVGHFSVILVQK